MLREILEDTTLYEVIEKDGKLEYNKKDGKRIKICEIKDVNFYEITAIKSNQYFTIDNGQRITKNKLESTNNGMSNPVEVYSSSEFDEEVFGYIEKTKLLELKPNQKIYNGKSILLNTGGSVGAIRLKNKPYEYTTIDNVVVYKSVEKICSIDYLYYALSSVMDRSKFNYANTLRGNDLIKADLVLRIPEEKKINDKLYSSYDIQLSISKNIEDKINNIQNKINIVEAMMKISEMKIENFLDKRIKELSNKKNLISLELTSKNNYYNFIKGKRITKSEIIGFKTVDNDIPIYSASKFDEEIFGFSNKDFLNKKGNQILTNPSILINADGSTGITRIKKDKKFAINDVVFAIEVLDERISLNYIKRIIDNELLKHNLNYANKLYETDLKNKKINIILPVDNNLIDYDEIKKIDDEVEKIKKSNHYLINIKEILSLAKEKVLQKIINGEI